MPELQDLLDTGAIDNIELDPAYVPTEDLDVMTKKYTEDKLQIIEDDVAVLSTVVDGGVF